MSGRDSPDRHVRYNEYSSSRRSSQLPSSSDYTSDPPSAPSHLPPYDRPRADPPRGPARRDRDREYGRYHEGKDQYNFRRSYGRKRRYSPSYGYARDENSYDSERRAYYDRDREPQSQPRRRGSYYDDYREASPHADKKFDEIFKLEEGHESGVPSSEVFLDGVPKYLNEDDLWYELEERLGVTHIQSVKVVRYSKTGESRQQAYIRFSSVSTASFFIARHYPFVYIGAEANLKSENQNAQNETEARSGSNVPVRISFPPGPEQRDTLKQNEWLCPACSNTNWGSRIKCRDCGTSKPGFAVVNHVFPAFNDGQGDELPDQKTPSQILLVRGLDDMDESNFATGAERLYKIGRPNAADPASTKQHNIISTTSAAVVGAKPGSIRRVLLMRNKVSHMSHGFGFVEMHSIADAQAAMSKYNAGEQFKMLEKPVILSYTHAGVFIPADPTIPEKFSFASLHDPSVRLTYWDHNLFASERSVNVDAPPQQAAAVQANKAPIVPVLKDAETTNASKTKKRKADGDKSSTKKKMPAHLEFWSKQHNEIHGSTAPDDVKDTGERRDVQNAKDVQERESDNDMATTKQSYLDPERFCCYLCSRQFPNMQKAKEHEAMSKLHAENLSNSDSIAKAVEILKARGLSIVQPSGDTALEYRDRARERRDVHNQPKNPAPASAFRPFSLAKAKPATTDEDAQAESTQQSKGAKLLGKMGWSSGEGLGKSGTGMAEPLEQNLYAAGVGLGAEGGNLGNASTEAARSTRGDYRDFVEKTKEKAKARYDAL